MFGLPERHSILAFAFALSTGLPAVIPCLANEPGGRGPKVGTEVVLRLSDGRLPRGTLDAATDGERVVISTAWPGMRMTSSFGRERVLELLDAAAYDRSLGNRLITVVGEPGRPLVVESPVVRSFGREFAEPRVASLFVRAEVANWDRDMEADGLLVQVVPLDEFGRPSATTGTLSVELFAQRLHTPRRPAFRSQERAFYEAERWSEPVEEAAFGPEGAFVKLPFRRLHPERDLDVAPEALLRARLVVPGKGTFEAEAVDVRLRPLSRFRDALEQRTGRRTAP